MQYNFSLSFPNLGQEKSEFWALLGGKAAYTDERILKSVGEFRPPRLFHGSNASGTFKSKKIFYKIYIICRYYIVWDVTDQGGSVVTDYK